MTSQEKFESIYKNQDIFLLKIKRQIGVTYKEDILQDFYIKILSCDTLPNNAIELLKFSHTVLNNLIIDIKKLNRYIFINNLNEISTNLDHKEESLSHLKSCSSLDINIKNYSECESVFIDSLDDCLLESYNKTTKVNQIILIDYYLMQYTMKELGVKNNIPIQTVKNIIYKFRQRCGININIYE